MYGPADTKYLTLPLKENVDGYPVESNTRNQNIHYDHLTTVIL